MDSSRLIDMVNQIARNLAAQGEAEAVEATARHLRDFWDPRMRAAILKADRSTLDPVAARALDRLEALPQP